MNVKESCAAILQEVGGSENVKDLKHCITRLRFTLYDDQIPNEQKIKEIPGVVGVVNQGGMYQVVIGPKVAEYYEEISTHLKDTEETKNEVTEKIKPGKKIMNFLSGIFVPCIPIMAATGVLKGILTFLTYFGWMDSTGSTYLFLYGIANTFFYFMPVFIAYTTGKKLNMNPVLCITIGASLIYPTFIAAAADGSINSIFGIPLIMQDYNSSLLPAIAAVSLAYWVEKLLNKVTPDVIKMFTVPLVTLVVVIPTTFGILGPVCTGISTVIANLTLAAYNFSPVICAIILGIGFGPLLLVGMHTSIIFISISNIATMGHDPLLGMLNGCSFANVGTLLAIAILTRNKQKKSTVYANMVSNIMGISEPGLYGSILPLGMKIYVGTLFAGMVGAVIEAVCGTQQYAVGASGIFNIINALGPNGVDMGFVGNLIALVVSFILGFLITFYFMKKDKSCTLDSPEDIAEYELSRQK